MGQHGPCFSTIDRRLARPNTSACRPSAIPDIWLPVCISLIKTKICPKRGTMVSREELYELVWSMPMTKVAEKFSVSGSYMARICSALRVPRPERGYWAKLEVGKAPAPPDLPEALPGDELVWSQEGDPPTPRVPRVTAASALVQRRARRVVTGIHSLIQGAKQHYERGYKVEEGQLLRPYKRQLVDVTASETGLDKALAFCKRSIQCLGICRPPRVFCAIESTVSSSTH